MSGHVDKAPARENRSTVVGDARVGAATDTTAALVDNRPATITQRKLRQTLDDSAGVSQLHAIEQAINQGDHVRQLMARRRADIPTDKPVQRVVKWNGVNYNGGKASLLRRALGKTELGAAEIDAIVAQAAEGASYVYTGVKRPTLQARDVAPLPLGGGGGGGIVVPVAQDDAPLALPGPGVQDPAQQVLPEPVVAQHDAPQIALDPVGDQHPAPVPLVPVLPVPALDPQAPPPGPDAQDGAPLVPVPVPVPLAIGHAAPGGGIAAPRVPMPRAPAGNRAALQDHLPKGKTVAEYQAEYAARTATVNAMAIPAFGVGRELFHATTRATARLIKATGLQPKQPAWGGGASSSKDNYLSFATRESKANAMGGRGGDVVLRVTLAADEVGPDKWRRASDTEVITTQSFAPGRLEWSPKLKPLNWQAMDTLPDR